MSNRSKRTTAARYPFADTIEGTLDTLKVLLSTGDVKHLELLPEEGVIRAVHYVTGDAPGEDDMTWDAALQSVEKMEEYYSPGAEAFQVVFDMMHLIAHYGCTPVQWVIGVNGESLLNEWLELEDRGMPGGTGLLMGVPLIELKSLPQESLILCGSKFSAAQPDEISFAVKTAVELVRSEHGHGKLKDSEVAYRGEDGSSKRSASAGAVEAATGKLLIPRWGARHAQTISR